MSCAIIIAGHVRLLVETLASYISRVYSEFGKILSREVQENLDAWEEKIEPHLGLTREHAALCAAVLQQLALGVIALEFGAVLFDRGPHMGPADLRARSRRPCWAWCWWWSSATSSCRRCCSSAPAGAGRSRCCGPSGCCCG